MLQLNHSETCAERPRAFPFLSWKKMMTMAPLSRAVESLRK